MCPLIARPHGLECVRQRGPRKHRQLCREPGSRTQDEEYETESESENGPKGATPANFTTETQRHRVSAQCYRWAQGAQDTNGTGHRSPGRSWPVHAAYPVHPSEFLRNSMSLW